MGCSPPGFAWRPGPLACNLSSRRTRSEGHAPSESECTFLYQGEERGAQNNQLNRSPWSSHPSGSRERNQTTTSAPGKEVRKLRGRVYEYGASSSEKAPQYFPISFRHGKDEMSPMRRASSEAERGQAAPSESGDSERASRRATNPCRSSKTQILLPILSFTSLREREGHALSPFAPSRLVGTAHSPPSHESCERAIHP